MMDRQLMVATVSRYIYRAIIRTGVFKWKVWRLFETRAVNMQRTLAPKDDGVVVLPKRGVIEVGADITKQDTVLPPQVLDYFIEKSNYRAIMNYCYCRDANECKDYPRDLGCLFLGEAARGIHPDMGRAATKEEAREHIRKCRESGMIHIAGKFWGDSLWLGVQPHEKLFTICNCCPCCCVTMVTPFVHPELTGIMHKLPGVNTVVGAECIGCGKCLGACIYGGVKLEGKQAFITEACRACGRCVEVCPQKALRITIDDPDYVQKAIAFLEPRVDLS